MLKVTQLIGFGSGSGPLEKTYLGGFGVASTNTDASFTLPSDTQSVVFAAGTNMNGFTNRVIEYIRVSGVDATQVVLAQRGDEYRCDTSIWCLNTGGGTKTISSKSSTGAAYGDAVVYVYALNKRFSSYTPTSSDTDTDASDPMDCTVNLYKDGLAIGSWYSKFGGPSCSAPLVADALSGACCGSVIPTSNVTNQTIFFEDGSGGNDGQTASLASWSPSSFSG